MLSSATIFAICGVILAIIGITISIYYGRGALSRDKRELVWSAETIRLLSDDVESYRSVVRVEIGEHAVTNPYLTRLRIKNVGKLDIESTMFDQGRPLLFKLTGQKFFHIVESGDPVVKATNRSIAVGPGLLPSGKLWTLSFITDDAVKVQLVENYLANVKVRNAEGVTQVVTPITDWAKLSGAAAATSGLAALVALLVQLFAR